MTFGIGAPSGKSWIRQWFPLIFIRSCLSVCVCIYLCVCVSVFLTVQAITFELLDIETSFSVCKYILDHIQVKFEYQGHWVKRQGHMRKNYSFTYFNFLIHWMWLQVINKVKVIHQGEGHIKVKVKISSSRPTLHKILLILTSIDPLYVAIGH